MRSVLEVKRIDLFSLFKIAFFVYAGLGLIFGFFYAFFLFLATGIGGAFIEDELPNFGLLGGVLGIVLVPVLAFLYGAIGSVIATIIGGILNLVMKAVGGLKMDVEIFQPTGAVPSAVTVPETRPVSPGGPQQTPPTAGPPRPDEGGPTTQGPVEPQG